MRKFYLFVSCLLLLALALAGCRSNGPEAGAETDGGDASRQTTAEQNREPAREEYEAFFTVSAADGRVTFISKETSVPLLLLTKDAVKTLAAPSEQFPVDCNGGVLWVSYESDDGSEQLSWAIHKIDWEEQSYSLDEPLYLDAQTGIDAFASDLGYVFSLTNGSGRSTNLILGRSGAVRFPETATPGIFSVPQNGERIELYRGENNTVRFRRTLLDCVKSQDAGAIIGHMTSRDQAVEEVGSVAIEGTGLRLTPEKTVTWEEYFANRETTLDKWFSAQTNVPSGCKTIEQLFSVNRKVAGVERKLVAELLRLGVSDPETKPSSLTEEQAAAFREFVTGHYAIQMEEPFTETAAVHDLARLICESNLNCVDNLIQLAFLLWMQGNWEEKANMGYLFADIDNDGMTDLLVWDENNSTLTVYRFLGEIRTMGQIRYNAGTVDFFGAVEGGIFCRYSGAGTNSYDFISMGDDCTLSAVPLYEVIRSGDGETENLLSADTEKINACKEACVDNNIIPLLPMSGVAEKIENRK